MLRSAQNREICLNTEREHESIIGLSNQSKKTFGECCLMKDLIFCQTGAYPPELGPPRPQAVFDHLAKTNYTGRALDENYTKQQPLISNLYTASQKQTKHMMSLVFCIMVSLLVYLDINYLMMHSTHFY